MNKKLSVLGLVIGLVITASAFADNTLSTESHVAVGADLGTTGLGLHVSVPVTDRVNGRFGINGYNYSRNGNASNVNYDFKVKLETFDALLDWFPFENQFRLSTGVVYNGTKVDANAKPSAGNTFTFNGQTYAASDVGSASASIDFRKVAPYLGIGWGNALEKNKGWGFTTDIGALFEGSARSHLSAVCGATAAAAPGGCAGLQSNVAAEQGNLDNKMSSYRVYPVIRLGATYKF